MTSTAPSLRRTPRLVAALAPAVLVLSACSGSGGGQPAAGGTPGAGVTPSASAGGEASSEPPQGSPLDPYLGVGAPIDAGGDDLATARNQEESIAQCMAKQGFQYVPNPQTFTVKPGPDGSQLISMDNAPLPDLPPDQFAAQYGYGISTALPASDQPDPSDQNDRIVRAMSVAERVAYYQALDGKDDPLDAQGNPTSARVIDDSSCQGRAYGATSEEESQQHRIDRVKASFKELLDRVGDMQDQLLADPRMVAASLAWSGCMASAGFPGYTDVSAPAEKVRKEALALMGPGFHSEGVDPTALAALRQEEIGLAVADNQCEQPWESTLAAVRLGAEKEFLEENLTELRSYRSAMAAATAATH
jgi:hypothetical protein